MSASTGESVPLKDEPQKARKGHRSDLKPVWCPGCGDYGVIAGLGQAIDVLGYESHRIVFVSGIGCSSRLPYFFNTYGFHTIHGRAAAVALGVKMGNPDMRVILVGGGRRLLLHRHEPLHPHREAEPRYPRNLHG